MDVLEDQQMQKRGADLGSSKHRDKGTDNTAGFAAAAPLAQSTIEGEVLKKPANKDIRSKANRYRMDVIHKKRDSVVTLIALR